MLTEFTFQLAGWPPQFASYNSIYCQKRSAGRSAGRSAARYAGRYAGTSAGRYAGRYAARLGDSLRMMNYCERSGSRKPTLSRSQPFQFVPCFEQSPFDSRSARQPANATGRDRSERDRSANATGRGRPPRDRSANATGPNATGPRTRQTAIRDRSRIMNYESTKSTTDGSKQGTG